ncbi:FRE2 [Cyberlindnera jadinii]|uniref:ferric-chelate reductase (NADPH) n=1 Tax=Cyberlindnera jadinii (strain ATCC 18201 / CBS 1600 / BCRC 20928 / JCM 3617 / NBRC 0987 / NRRL Y-1542) TaxID=983966 RepID=A0A0H5CHK9_CYBJN|nr:FRE2 [Cyberlindnera jadinii]
MRGTWALSLMLMAAEVVLAGPSKTEKLGTPGRMCLYSCMEGMEDAMYDYVPPEEAEYYGSYCLYPPAIGTMTVCAANFFGAYSKNFNGTIKAMVDICALYGGSHYGKDYYYDQYANATNYIESIEGVNLTSTYIYSPFSIPKNETQVYYKYYQSVYYNWDMPSMFAGIFYCYFIFVFLIVGAVNYMKRLGYQNSLNNKWINMYRKYVSIPALFNNHHTEAPVFLKVFSTLVPTRSETIIIFFFICLNILLGTVHYDVLTTYNSRYVQLTILVADRTGLLSFGLVPLLILFAGRNNFLIQLTGLPYTSFIMFHKWVARLMFLHALIHSCCWTAYGVHYGYLSYYASQRYWIWGIVATILGGLLWFQAFHVFRAKVYEIFLIIHIIFAALFIVGCWWHCYDFGYLEWIYASMALWCFDRLVRLLRMAAFGYREANVQYISDDTFKISIQRGKFFNSFPGSFAYLYFLTPYGFWQSHPFTIIDSALKEGEITVYIKAKRGMTKYLKNKCIKAGGNTTMRVCVEGPYGHHAPTQKYDTALLYAGGNGIPGPYYHAVDLAKRNTKQQIKLLWTVRNPEAILWFYKELMQLQNLNMKCDIYITGALSKATSDSEKEKHSSSSDSDPSATYQGCIEQLSQFITFHYERPNFKELLVTEFTQENQGTICVMSCGPPKMVDEIRKLVGQNFEKSSKRVDLFEELQVW